jgi:anion-transporting  ArsA/GET3 family ATPase
MTMTDDQFLTSSRILIVAGKGGTGKSTVARALAVSAARTGLRTLLVVLDGVPPLLPPTALLDVLQLTPGRALAEHLEGRGLGIVSRRLANSGLVELVASTAPGIDDLLVLGRIKSLARGGDHDLIVVDGPAAGHALDMLRAPSRLAATVTGGPIAHQDAEAAAMLADPSACRIVLVTVPAVTPVQETAEAARALWDGTAATLAAVVVNMCEGPVPDVDDAGLEPRLRAALAWGRERAAGQADALARLGASLPLRQIRCSRHRLGGAALVDAVAADIAAGIALAPGEGAR